MEPYTIKGMTRGHKDVIDLFDKTSRKSKNRHTRGFAQSTFRALQHPLKMARRLHEKSSAALGIP